MNELNDTSVVEPLITRANRLRSFPGGAVNIDGPAVEAELRAQRANFPLRMRIQPDPYFAQIDAGQPKYMPWAGVIWHMEFQDAADMVRFRLAMHDFIVEWFATYGEDPRQSEFVAPVDEPTP